MIKIDVLEDGYVGLVDVMGTDLSVANAARASFQKASDSLTSKDIRLIHFLAREQHLSPFRHACISFEIKAPLMVARQWWKYVVGSDHTMDAWNEASRRYITFEPEFYIPTTWRQAPDNKKQGSGDSAAAMQSLLFESKLRVIINQAMIEYNEALDKGIAPEMARLFLPAYAMHTVWRWSASLQSIGHFLSQRLEDDAQFEIREYAHAVYDLVQPRFPHSIAALLGRDDVPRGAREGP